MGLIFKIAFYGALFIALFYGLNYFAGQTDVNTQLGHISAVFVWIVGNARAYNDIFPVNNLLLMIGAIFAVETLIVAVHVVKFISKNFRPAA